LVLGQNVLVIIRALGVGHNGELELGGVIPDDAAQVLFAAVFPGAVFAGNNDLLGRLVAQLHVIHARGHARLVDRLDNLVVKLVVVHEAAVPDGAIEDFDLRAVRYPACGGCFLGFGCFGGFGFGGHKACVLDRRFRSIM
jgi:hypothetical protein